MIVSCNVASHEKGVKIQREADFPHWTCAYLRYGEIDFRADRQRLVVGGPGFICIPPAFPYEFTVSVADEHVWAIFTGTARLAKSLAAIEDRVHFDPLDLAETDHAGLAAAMQDTHRWWSADPIRVLLAENALERALLLYCQMERSDAVNNDPRIAETLEFIAHNWASTVSVPDLAKRVHLSPSRFAALFRKETGTTPARHLEAKRMEAACDLLLSTNLAIAEISESVGYGNAFHFSTRFRANWGQSPRDFRRNPSRSRHEIEPELPHAEV